jgi:signal transduction histidine kinase
VAFSIFRHEQFYDLLHRKAKTAAVLLTELEEVTTSLLKKLKDNSASTLSSENILLYDLHHKLIFNNNSTDWPISEEFLNRIQNEKYFKFSMKKYSGLGIFHEGEKDKIIAVILAQDSYGDSVMSRLKAILITVLIISVIVIVIAGRIYVDKTLQPINNLIEKVNSIGANNLSERIDCGNRTDEIAKLSKAFNSMLNRMEAAFQSQKLFIANASHELRTPLTIISGQLDVLLLKARSIEEYKHGISNAYKDILSLIRMANRLLVLAHASSDFTEIRYSTFRIDDAIWAARQELKDINPEAIVNVNFSDEIQEDRQIKIVGNEMLLGTAFLNLMENGCKYSANKTVTVVLETNNNEVVVRFLDQGIGIKTDEISHLFEPFYRGTNTGGAKGKGIGLSIVSKVIKLHQGNVKINSNPGKGSEFIVSLPLFRNDTLS